MVKNRRIYDSKRALLVKELAKKHKCEPDFVRKAINGERDSDLALTIKSEYDEAYKKLSEVLK